METNEYQVTGMSCAHCERQVTNEVIKVAGVESVTVSASDGILKVAGSSAIDSASVIAAVIEAGYGLGKALVGEKAVRPKRGCAGE